MAVSIPSSEINPFVRPLALLALLAFPNPDEKKDRLLLLRALLLQVQTRHLDSGILNSFLDRKYFTILSKGSRRLKQRQSAGRIAMFQILNLKREGFSPTLKNQEQMERILLGWDFETVNSDSTYKTKVWGTTRPVLHLAAALFWIQAFNEATYDQVFSHLTSSSDDFDYFLELAENIRLGLPSVHRMYRHEQFFKIESGATVNSIGIELFPKRMDNFRRPFLLFIPASKVTSQTDAV